MPTPVVAERPAQPYVAIKAQVTMQTMDTVLVPLHPQVFAWLGERNIPPAGPPFWKYNVIDMDGLLEVEVGVPVASPADGDGSSARRLRAGSTSSADAVRPSDPWRRAARGPGQPAAR